MSEGDNHIEKINDIIRQVTEEATFSAGAMKQFLALKDEVDSQESTLRYLRGNNKEKDEQVRELQRDLEKTRDLVGDLNSQLAEWEKRKAEVEDREGQATELRVRLEMNEQRVKDHQLMFSTVFKGYHMRRQVVSPPTQGFVDNNNMTQYGDPAQKHDVEDQE